MHGTGRLPAASQVSYIWTIRCTPLLPQIGGEGVLLIAGKIWYISKNHIQVNTCEIMKKLNITKSEKKPALLGKAISCFTFYFKRLLTCAFLNKVFIITCFQTSYV